MNHVLWSILESSLKPTEGLVEALAFIMKYIYRFCSKFYVIVSRSIPLKEYKSLMTIFSLNTHLQFQ